MNNNINATDLQNAPINQSFKAYLMPAMFAMVIKALYIVIDTAFVGRGVGSIALGAMAMTVPFFSVFTAVALTIGIGGAARMSISLGSGDRKAAQDYFNQSILLIIISEVVMITLFMYFLSDIIHMMGATGELASLTYDYVIIMLPCFMAHGLGLAVGSFVRNDSNPKLVMYAALTATIANVILDYIFIFPLDMGIKGAALATGIAQIIMAVMLLYHFKIKRGVLRLERLKLKFSRLRDILSIGSPTFFVETTTGITTIVFNYVLLANYTDMHVAVYGIINNIGLVIMFLLVGVGQACQPIMSYNYGAKRKERIMQTLALGLKVSVSIGIATVLIMFAGASFVANIFVKDDNLLIELSSYALKVYFVATPLMGFNAVVASLFQSVDKAWSSTIISISRGFLFVVVGVLFLPSFIGETGIWASVLFAEFMTLIISVIMLNRYKQ